MLNRTQDQLGIETVIQAKDALGKTVLVSPCGEILATKGFRYPLNARILVKHPVLPWKRQLGEALAKVRRVRHITVTEHSTEVII